MVNPLPDGPGYPAASAYPAVSLDDVFRAQVEANATNQATLTATTYQQVASLIRNFHDWYNDLAVQRLAQQIAAVVQPAQHTMQQSELAFLDSVLAGVKARRGQPRLARLDNLSTTRSILDRYQNLGAKYRYQRSLGKNHADALKTVLDAADSMVEKDIGEAARKQDAMTLFNSDVIGYRRVIHPELSAGGTCGLCIAATGRVFHKAKLAPIHRHCHCTVAPVTDAFDPGNSLNNLDIQQLYSDAKGSTAGGLKQTRYKLGHDGQLYPVKVKTTKYQGDYKGNRQRRPSRSHRRNITGDQLRHASDENLERRLSVALGAEPSTWRSRQITAIHDELARRAHAA